NWEVFIGAAIALASVFLHRIEDARRWGERAKTRLVEILRNEIGPDGIMKEQVPMYQGVCALALADLLVAFPPNQSAAPPQLVQGVRTLTAGLTRIAGPSGRIPQIGDSDAFEMDYLERFVGVVLGESLRNPAEPDRVRVDVLPSVGWAVARWPGNGYL